MEIKRINFEYIEEFVEYLTNLVYDDEDMFITVVAKYNEMHQILEDIIASEEVYLESIHFDDIDVAGCNEDYCLSMNLERDKICIKCTPLKVDRKYTNPCGDNTYLFPNISSDITFLCEGSNIYLVNIAEDEECNGCDHECFCNCPKNETCVECSVGEDEDIHGFTASKSDDDGYYSFSFYTSNTLSKEDIHSMLKKYGF